MDHHRLDESEVAKNDAQAAPWYTIPSVAITSVEHPCIIQNIDRGIQTLGGPSKLDEFLRSNNSDKVIPLSLRPDDAFARPIMSKPVRTDTIVLRISVPKRTGRKRKRGSSGAYIAESELEANGMSTKTTDEPASRLFRSMRDNTGKTSVHPAGSIRETHRFRTLPDFEFASTHDPLYNEIRAYILPFSVSKLKSFKINPSKTLRPGASVGPPAVMALTEAPHNYAYRQNPYVRWTTSATGQPVSFNIQSVDKHALRTCDSDDATVPDGPPPYMEPEGNLNAHNQELLRRLRAAFTSRPIMTRRVMFNLVTDVIENQVKLLLPYVAYVFPAGPWRDALIAYGVDPRSNPKYRGYQTMMFKIPMVRQVVPQDGDAGAAGGGAAANDEERRDERARRKANAPGWMDNRVRWRRMHENRVQDVTSHIFDGKRVVVDGRVWQVCDVTDPLIKGILDTNNLRTKCETRSDGWYHNGTWAMARVLIRDKINVLVAGATPEDDDYANIVRLPDVITMTGKGPTLRELGVTTATEKEIWLASEIRAMARGPISASKRMKEQKERQKQNEKKPRAGSGVESEEVDGIGSEEKDGDGQSSRRGGKDSDDEGSEGDGDDIEMDGGEGESGVSEGEGSDEDVEMED